MAVVEKRVGVQFTVAAATARALGMSVPDDVPDCALLASKGIVLKTFLHDVTNNNLVVQMVVINPTWQHTGLTINEDDILTSEDPEKPVNN